jgi:broad specificity phosphatase PhoE
MHLVLVRHGEVDAAPGLCIGHTDVALSADGRRAISALVESWNTRVIAAPSRIVSSDLVRARESARPFGERFARRVEHEAAYREMSYGRWDGRPWIEIEAAEPAALQAWRDTWLTSAPPGGESVPQLIERARRALADICARPREGPSILVVSHAGWIRAAVGTLLGEPTAAMFERPIDNATATIVHLHPNAKPELVAVNATSIG